MISVEDCSATALGASGAGSSTAEARSRIAPPVADPADLGPRRGQREPDEIRWGLSHVDEAVGGPQKAGHLDREALADGEAGRRFGQPPLRSSVHEVATRETDEHGASQQARDPGQPVREVGVGRRRSIVEEMPIADGEVRVIETQAR